MNYITKEQAVALGHRKAWKYNHSKDPNHSSTYTFNDTTLTDLCNAAIQHYIDTERVHETAKSGQVWQTMDSAPEEGDFLVFLPNDRNRVQHAWKNTNGVFVIGSCFAFDLTNPTHWMPLPAAPSTGEPT